MIDTVLQDTIVWSDWIKKMELYVQGLMSYRWRVCQEASKRKLASPSKLEYEEIVLFYFTQTHKILGVFLLTLKLCK